MEDGESRETVSLVSIIIVNWNSRELLRKCLLSIRKEQNYLNYQVIVIDNNSKDFSADLVRKDFPEVILIESGGNIGFGCANNLAKPHINSPFVLFLNPDTEVTGDAIDCMLLAARQDRSIGALGCRLIYPNGETQPLGIQWFPNPIRELASLLLLNSRTFGKFQWLFPYQDPNRSGFVKKIYGGCLMVRRDLIDRIGWFDPRFFMYAEDVDLCRRITDSGHKIYYLSEVSVVHSVGGASGIAGSDFTALMKCESVGKLMQKYYGSAGSIGYRLAMFIGASARLIGWGIWSLLSWVIARPQNSPSSKAAFRYLCVLRWSIGLQNPEVKF